jgi:hypothetical protein
MSDPITAMAVGAALGGGTSAIKGGNVFKGALLGGALGGAGSGLMGAMGSGAAGGAAATGAGTAGEIGGLNLVGQGVAGTTAGVGTAATQVMPSLYTTPSVYGGGAASSMLDKTGAFIRDIPSNLYESAKNNPFQTASTVSNMIPTQQQQRQMDTSVPPLLRSTNAGELTYGMSPEQRELEKIIRVQQQRGTFPYNILGQ